MNKTVKLFSIFTLLFVFSFIGIMSVKATKITISDDKNGKVDVGKYIDVTFSISEYDYPGNVEIKII